MLSFFASAPAKARRRDSLFGLVLTCRRLPGCHPLRRIIRDAFLRLYGQQNPVDISSTTSPSVTQISALSSSKRFQRILCVPDSGHILPPYANSKIADLLDAAITKLSRVLQSPPRIQQFARKSSHLATTHFVFSAYNHHHAIPSRRALCSTWFPDL